MSAFKGFSDNQLRKGEKEVNFIKDRQSPAKAIALNKAKPLPKTKRLSPNNGNPHNNVVNDDIPPEAFLSSKTSMSSTTEFETLKSPNKSVTSNQSAAVCLSTSEEDHATDPDILIGTLNNIDEDQKSEIKLNTAEDIQKRKKELEEENKAKRQLLAKAIADRKLKTTQENKKLTQCQNELQKIDLLVASDIGLLRKTIEEASIEFSEAQKRYDRAEKEFVEAKLCLHKKQERKELLTEHLAAIIEDCEVRKARKLNELMSQLELKKPVL